MGLQFGRLVTHAKKSLADRRETKPVESSGARTSLALDLASTPSGSPASQADPSIEQYAWLVALLRKTPAADLPVVLAGVSLTPESRRELEERWARRMASDPALREMFLAALARHMKGPGR